MNPRTHLRARLLVVSAVATLTPLPATAQAPPVTAGLKVQLDAGGLANLSSGEIVTSWPDSAVGLIPGDAAQDAVLAHGLGAPKFIAADPVFGGKPAVEFTGADALGFAGSLGLATGEGAQPFTVFVVATSEATAIAPAFSFGDIKNNVADGTLGASMKCDISVADAGLRFNGGNRLFGPAFEPDRARIGMYRMGVGTTYGEAIFRSDNRAKVPTNVTAAGETLNLLDEGYHVGAGMTANSGVLNELADGRIAEILFYNRELSDAEANEVGFHLEQKYGLDTAYTDPAVADPPQDPRPNVVLILLDDLGWSDIGCYGGEARTPRMDALAAQGLRFRNFHNTARCSTTRAALLTGAYTQQVAQVPGASLPNLRTDNNITIPELLFNNGYRTYMAGKWHLGTAPYERTTSRGFQHVVGIGTFASGHGVDYWDEGAHNIVSAENEIPLRDYPDGTFHHSDALGDYGVDFLDHHFAKNDGASFFLYLPYNPPHFALQAPAALADTYMDIYDDGWDVVREARYNRMLAEGIIDTTYLNSPFSDSPYNDTLGAAIQPVPAWDSLAADRKADLIRRMALYSAMIEQVDQSIGRVIDRLDAEGQLDNTIVMVMSDNGGNAEGGMFGQTFGQNNHPPLTGAQLTNMGQPGANDNLWLGGGWANVNNTPFRYYKRYSHEGGIRTPLIVHWPDGIANPGRWTDQNSHLVDIMKTLVDITGVTFPQTFAGHTVVQPEGASLVPVFDNQPEFPRQLGYEHESTRAWVDGDWKLVTKTFSSTDGSSPAHMLELYNMADDPTELNNLAASNTQRVRAMVDAWNAWATRVGVPQDRLLDLPQPTSSTLPGDLFKDNFNRPYSTDADASQDGMTGSLIPPMGAGSAYYEGYEGSGLPDSIQILDGRMQLAVGPGMSETGLMHNFIGQDIIDAGGFSVEMTVTAINSTGTDLGDRYGGFGVGLTETEAAGGGEIGTPVTFRGRTSNPVGQADFFVDLDLNGNLKAWSHGQLIATVPVGATTGTLTAKFALDGFSTTSTVEVTAFFNGQPVDLDGADPNSITRTFSWEHDNQNYIGLSARGTGYVGIDNLAIRKLPLADGLSLAHAVAAGLEEDDTAPGADPDGDGRPNFLEWAIGTDPAVPDAGVTPMTLVTIDPGADRFRFEIRRLESRDAAGVEYVVMVSDDLEDWTSVDAVAVSVPQPIAGKPGYETVELELPAGLVDGKTRLFALISVTPAP